MNSKIKKNKTNKKRMVASHPPPYISQSVRTIKVRYSSTGGGTNIPVSYANLANMLGLVCTGAGTTVYLSNVFRLRRVTLWAPTTAGVNATLSLSWVENTADYESPPSTHTDNSISPEHPAFVDVRPPKGSLADKWHGSAQTDNCFQMSYVASTTMDLTFEFVINDLNATLVAGPSPFSAPASGVIGHLRFNANFFVVALKDI